MSSAVDFSIRNVLSFIMLIFWMFSLLKLGNTAHKPQYWSYLVLAQRWPVSACLDLRHGECRIPKYMNDWIIHGLWPTSEKGYPSFCNGSWTFDKKDLEPILGGLEGKWPNIIKGTSNCSFWKHEWQKHGTCATSVSSMDSILKYFTQTLELHDKFNFYEILRKLVINPGEIAYVLPWIETGIKLHLNKTIKILCKSHKDYEFPLLDTVYFCFDKNFDLIDCDIPQEKSCNSSRVIYPPFPKHWSSAMKKSRLPSKFKSL